MKKDNKQYGGEQNLVLSKTTSFAAREAYKTLRTNLIFSFAGIESKSIVITSGTKGEAKSTTALNLAITFAENHSKVLLIDCDLRLPVIASKLNIKASPGLSNYLVGVKSLSECIHSFSNGLSIMTAGLVPPNPTELLGSERMKAMLQELGEKYEYIILDAPPLDTMSDAMILSKLTAGTLLVVRQNHGTRDHIAEAVKKLEFAGAKILGFVLTDVKNSKFGGYGKYGSYGYGYGK